jgi:hypothetical protein
LGLPWEAIIKQKIKTPEIKVKRSNEKLEAFLTGFPIILIYLLSDWIIIRQSNYLLQKIRLPCP